MYNTLHEETRALSQAWTLAVEITFYLFIPLFAWVLRKVARCVAPAARGPVHFIVLVGMDHAATAFRVWCFYGEGRVHALGQSWLPANLDLFALGMGVAVVSVAIQLGLWPRRAVAFVEHWP